MVRFASVETGIWRWFGQQGLTLEERYLMLYLLTNPHTNMVGYYYLPRAYMQDDTGWDDATLDRVFVGLKTKAKVYYDDRAKVVLLSDFLEHNRIESEKQLKGALKAVREVPKSRLLYEFVKAAKQHCPKFESDWDSLLIGYRYPTDTVSIPGQDTVPITGTGTVTDTDTDTGSEVVVVDDGKAEFVEFVNRHLPTWPNAGEKYARLLDYAEDFGWKVLLEAVKRTLAAGKTSLSYCEGICARWLDAGVSTIEDVEAVEARFAASRARRDSTPVRQQAREVHPIDEFERRERRKQHVQ